MSEIREERYVIQRSRCEETPWQPWQDIDEAPTSVRARELRAIYEDIAPHVWGDPRRYRIMQRIVYEREVWPKSAVAATCTPTP